MEGQPAVRLLVPAGIENLRDTLDARHGRIAASEVRLVEVPDAWVNPDVLGLLMPLRLVEQLGLEPILARWVVKILASGRPVEFPRPIPYRAVRLAIRGRECTLEVGAIADHHPVVIGLTAVGALGWMVGADGLGLVEDTSIVLGTSNELNSSPR